MPPDDVGQAPTIQSGEFQSAAPTANTDPTVASDPGSDRATTTRLLSCIELGPGVEIGDYRIEGKLGEGGMGEVYGAVHAVIGKRAAIKVLRLNLCTNPLQVERFIQEARAVNQIGHPNIVDVFAFGTLSDGRSYLAMEWLRGESLSARLRRAPMPIVEACEILDPVTRALEAAHEQRIIHRDLKPDNTFLVAVKDSKPLVKLLDFGIAKLADSDDTRRERTRTGSLLGTPQYISPEQARGRDVDHRADVYSFGAMAFEMFCGRPPFVHESPMELVAAHLHEQPPRPSLLRASLPRELDDLLLGLLEKDIECRPSLAHVREVLAKVSQQTPSQPAGVPSTSFAYEPTEAAAIPTSATVNDAAVVAAESESVSSMMAVARPRRVSVAVILIAALATVVAAGTTWVLRGSRHHATKSPTPRAVRVPTETPMPAAAPTLAPAATPTPAPVPTEPPAPAPSSPVMHESAAVPATPAPERKRRPKRTKPTAPTDDEGTIDPFKETP